MKDFFTRKIISTADGSNSIYLPDLDEHYHSIHGAMQESKHVFVEMGWKKIEDANEISILEIGFGTGLNAFLILQECMRNGSKKIFYESLEAFPVAEEDAQQLNYAENEAEQKLFMNLHQAKWNANEIIVPNFILRKDKITLEEFIPQPEKFNLIFFDAFSPDKQPELWTEEIFKKMFAALKQNGMLVTYCAKGQVRRNMLAAGFTVERLQGPPGKREMLRGGKLPIGK